MEAAIETWASRSRLAPPQPGRWLSVVAHRPPGWSRCCSWPMRRRGRSSRQPGGGPVRSRCPDDGQRPRRSQGGARMRRIRMHQPAGGGNVAGPGAPGCATRSRGRSSAPSPRQRRPKQDMRTVSVSEFLSLGRASPGGRAQDRPDRFERGGWPLPSLEDAGGALGGGNRTLIEGGSDEGRAPRTGEKRLGWTQ